MVEDELGTSIVPCIQLEVEGAIERRGGRDIEVGTTVTHGVSVVLDPFNPQIPKVRKLRNEIKNLVMVSPRKFQFQGLQGLQKCAEVFFHL